VSVDIFGAAAIALPDGTVLTASKSPVAFAFLFRLAIDAGTLLPRSQVVALLYDDDSKATRLRFNTLLASQRERGVQFISQDGAIGLAADTVRWTAPHAGTLFGGWGGEVSRAYEEWFDNERRRIALRFLEEPLAAMHASREQARWSDVAAHSRRILDLDPLNEAAHAAMVEALMFTASKVQAIEYLAYAEEIIGERSAFARQPLASLRERIVGEPATGDAGLRDAPVYARAGVLEQVGSVAARVRATSVVAGIALTGPAGVGKSTMWNAALSHLGLLGWSCVRTRCLESEREFPLSLVYRLVPALLAARGAGGAAPEMYALLRDVYGGTRALSGSVRDHQHHVATALVEVIGAVASEGPLVIAIDDTHWLDTASRALLDELIDRTPAGCILWVCAERRTDFRWPAAFTVVPVGGLTDPDAEDLLRRWLGADSGAELPGNVRSALDATGGNPLWIRSVALGVQRGRTQGSQLSEIVRDPGEALIDEARRLPPDVLDLLRYVAVLGPLATVSRLSALYRDQRRRILIDALGVAEGLGLVHASATLGSLNLHDVWAGALQREMSSLQARLVHTELLELLMSESPPDHAATAHLWGIIQCARGAGTPGRAADSACILITKWLAAGVDAIELESLFDIIDADDIAPDALVRLTEQLTMFLGTSYQHELLLGMSRRLSDRLARAGVRSPLFEAVLALTRAAATTGALLGVSWPTIEAFVRDTSRTDGARLEMLHAGLRLRSNDPLSSSMPMDEWRAVLDSLSSVAETLRAKETRLILCTEQFDQPGMRAASQALVRFCDAYGRGISSVERIRARNWAAHSERVLGVYRRGMEISKEAVELALSTRATLAAIRALDSIVTSLGDTGHWNEADAVLRAMRELAEHHRLQAEMQKSSSWNGWESSIAVRIALNDTEGARRTIERVVPLSDPSVLVNYMLPPKAGLQAMAATIAVLSDRPVDVWRGPVRATLMEFTDAMRSVQFSHTQGNLWKLAVAGAALQLADETRDFIDALLAQLGEVRWSFPFESFRDLVGAPPREVIEFAFRGRPVLPLADVYGVDKLPAIFTHPLDA